MKNIKILDRWLKSDLNPVVLLNEFDVGRERKKSKMQNLT